MKNEKTPVRELLYPFPEKIGKHMVKILCEAIYKTGSEIKIEPIKEDTIINSDEIINIKAGIVKTLDRNIFYPLYEFTHVVSFNHEDKPCYQYEEELFIKNYGIPMAKELIRQINLQKNTKLTLLTFLPIVNSNFPYIMSSKHNIKLITYYIPGYRHELIEFDINFIKDAV